MNFIPVCTEVWGLFHKHILKQNTITETENSLDSLLPYAQKKASERTGIPHLLVITEGVLLGFEIMFDFHSILASIPSKHLWPPSQITTIYCSLPEDIKTIILAATILAVMTITTINIKQWRPLFRHHKEYDILLSL